MKEKKKLKNKVRPTSNRVVYFILRLLVFISAIAQAIHGNWHNVFLCILTLILFTAPALFSRKYNIVFPKTLEIIIYLFIYAAEICGEMHNFYGLFPYWDTMLHTLNGFISAAIGFSLIDILNRNEMFHIHMTPLFVALVSFCFSMTVGVMWEFFEFGADYYFAQDMQKDRIVENIHSKEIEDKSSGKKVDIEDITKTVIYKDGGKNTFTIEGGYLDIGIIDTMKDLFVNFVGAVVFSLIGLLYIKDRDEYKFAERFLVKLKQLK